MNIGKALASIGVCATVVSLLYFKVGDWGIHAGGIVIAVALVTIWEGWDK